MLIQISRKSYRTYRYSELILITDLCLFRTPVGVTELINKLRSLHLFRDTRRYHREYGTYTGIAELILVLYGTYSYTKVLVSTTKLILVLRILYLYYEVHFIVQNLYLVYRYGSTRRYYLTYT